MDWDTGHGTPHVSTDGRTAKNFILHDMANDHMAIFTAPDVRILG